MLQDRACVRNSLSVNGLDGVRAVVIVGGRAIAALGQTRPCMTDHDCIEQPLAATNEYQRAPHSAIFNDRVSIVAP